MFPRSKRKQELNFWHQPHIPECISRLNTKLVSLIPKQHMQFPAVWGNLVWTCNQNYVVSPGARFPSNTETKSACIADSSCFSQVSTATRNEESQHWTTTKKEGKRKVKQSVSFHCTHISGACSKKIMFQVPLEDRTTGMCITWHSIPLCAVGPCPPVLRDYSCLCTQDSLQVVFRAYTGSVYRDYFCWCLGIRCNARYWTWHLPHAKQVLYRLTVLSLQTSALF